MSCLVCKKSDILLFNIGTHNGNNNHTIEDDFNEIYGEKAKFYLNPENSICSICMKVLSNIAKLLRSIWNIISNPTNQSKQIKLNKFWRFFASLKIDGDEIEDVIHYGNSPIPNLLINSFSVPFNEQLEEQIAQQQRSRSLSRTSSYVARSELAQIFPSGKSRRNSRGTSVRSQSSSTYGRRRQRDTYTPYSTLSGISTGTQKSKRDFSYTDPKRKATPVTRALSREREREEEQKTGYENIIYCTENDCHMFSYNVEKMNLHQMEEHEMELTCQCQECPNMYTTQDLLSLHMKFYNHSFFCLMCGKEQQNLVMLQNHLDQHMNYSTPCKYCDKSFLNSAEKDNHLKNCSGMYRNQRRIFKEKLILDQIVKNGERPKKGRKPRVLEQTMNNNEKVNLQEKEFDVFLMIYKDLEIEEGDMDVSIENFEKNNLPVYTDINGYDLDSDDDSIGVIEIESPAPTIEEDNVNLDET